MDGTTQSALAAFLHNDQTVGVAVNAAVIHHAQKRKLEQDSATKVEELEHAKKLLFTDKRGGSKAGRPKAKARLPCNWKRQYLDKDPVYTEKDFRDSFGAPRGVFEELVAAISDDLTVASDAAGKSGMTPEIAVLAALRTCRAALAAKQLDDQVGFSASTIRGKVRRTIESALEHLAPKYLPDIDSEEELAMSMLETELTYNAENMFEGCGGKMDCMHLKWRKCPKHLQAGFTSGKDGCPSVVVSAVAHDNLWCSHVYVGEPGSENDITTLRNDPLFGKVLGGWGRDTFRIGTDDARPFLQAYFLVDGIYPEWAIFAKPGFPTTAAEANYVKAQEARRKAVERLFGVVQGRFKIMRKGVGVDIHDIEELKLITRFCFMVHNMIVAMHEEYGTQFGHGGVAMAHVDVVQEFVGEVEGGEAGAAVNAGEGADDDAWAAMFRDRMTAMTSRTEYKRLRSALVGQDGFKR